MSSHEAAQASSSIGEAFRPAQESNTGLAQEIIAAAKTAFISSHSVALSTAGVLLIVLAVGIWFSLAKAEQQ